MLTGIQIRAALAGIGWSRADLAEASGVSPRTVQRVCEADGVPSTQADNLAAIEAALAARGVEFIERGVRFAPQV